MNPRQLLGRVSAPDEAAIEERAWEVVRAAYRERPVAVPERRRWRVALAPVLAALLTGLALSPAGATVGGLIRRAFEVPHSARALYSLPAPGRLLLSGPGGTWTVSSNGSSRKLGVWSQASWSPHGLYVVAARGDQLSAVDPRGVVRWQLARPAVSDPSWYAPSGYRVAYLSGHQLRVVAGDGTGDHEVASSVAHVTPAWRSDHPYQLAYLNGRGSVVVREADTGQVVWTARVGNARSLQWSADGDRLLVLTSTLARIYSGRGHLLAQVTEGMGVSLAGGSLSPNGRRLALLRSGLIQDIAVANLTTRAPEPLSLLSGTRISQAAWAPDSRWLLVGLPAADQWVFLHVGGTPRISVVSRINKQFGAGSRTRGSLPRLEGWCCTASGSPG